MTHLSHTGQGFAVEGVFLAGTRLTSRWEIPKVLSVFGRLTWGRFTAMTESVAPAESTSMSESKPIGEPYSSSQHRQVSGKTIIDGDTYLANDRFIRGQLGGSGVGITKVRN